MDTKNVLIILYGYTNTYSEAQPSRALHLYNELRKNFPNTYIIMQDNGGCHDDNNQILIKPFIQIDGRFKFIKGLLYTLQASYTTIMFMQKNHINCVIIRSYDTVFILIYLLLKRIKIIFDFHGLYELELLDNNRKIRAFIVKYITKIILKYSNRILVISEGVKSQIKKYSNKCINLPNGIDVNNIRSQTKTSLILPHDKKIIGFIGNWEYDKKIEDVLDSINYLDNCVAVIVGHGHNADEIFNKYKSNDNIIFTGRISANEVYSILNKFDICILPYDKNSKLSQQPNIYSTRKAKDYIGAGKPIIVSNIIGRENWLIENESCLLYDPGNPLDLANKIKYLLSNNDLYEKISLNNKSLADNFTWSYLISNSGIIDSIKND